MRYDQVEMRLSELGKIVGGATPNTKHNEFYDGDIAWLTPKDLSGHNSRWISCGKRNITQKGYDSCSTQMLPEGSILFSSRAPIGYIAIAKNSICTNQGFKSIIPNKSVVDPLFVYYLLKFYTPRIEATASGTTFKEVSGANMRNFKVIIPKSIKIQERIAKILGSIDDRIELNNEIIHNLELQAQLIILEAINSTRSKTIDEYAFINPKRTLKKGINSRYIDMSSLSTTSAVPIRWEFKKFTGGMKFSNGDTLLARITPCLENGKAAYINFLNEKEVAFGSTEFIVLHSKGVLPNEFFYCLIRTHDFRQFAVKHLTGTSGRQRVSSEDIKSYPLPEFSSQKIDFLNKNLPPIFNSVTSYALENATLAKLSDTLLPKLLSGELSVNEL